MAYPMGNGEDTAALWLRMALERLLAAEHRQTATEWTVANHEGRIATLEADARMVRDGLLRLFRGLAVFGVTFGLGHVVSGGALWRALIGLFGR